MIAASVDGPTIAGDRPVDSYDTDVLVVALSASGATRWTDTYDSGSTLAS